MNIQIKYFGFFEDLAAKREEVIRVDDDNFRVEDLINFLSKKYGDKFVDTLVNSETKQLKEGCVLLLNEMKGDLHQAIKEGDIISLLPILAGG